MMHPTFVELHALARDHRENPISSWNVKGVRDGVVHGSVRFQDGSLRLVLDGVLDQRGLSSLPQALRMAEDALARRFVH